MPHVSDTELRVLLVVVRSTLGWQDGKARKERDWISHHQLRVRTGRSSSVVSRAIDGLVKHGVLAVTNAAGAVLGTAKSRSQARGQLYFRVQVPGKPRTSKVLHLDNIDELPAPQRSMMRETAPYASKTKAANKHSTFNTSPQKLRATKETGTKEIKNMGGRVITLLVPTSKNEVSRLTRGEIQSLMSTESESGTVDLANAPSKGDGNSNEADFNRFGFEGGGGECLELSADMRRFIESFNEAYKIALSGKEPPPFTPGTSALLGRRLHQYSIEKLEAWLPRFFECSFGYVRRRHWSLESYLESFQLLQAKGSLRRQEEPADNVLEAA